MTRLLGRSCALRGLDLASPDDFPLGCFAEGAEGAAGALRIWLHSRWI